MATTTPKKTTAKKTTATAKKAPVKKTAEKAAPVVVITKKNEAKPISKEMESALTVGVGLHKPDPERIKQLTPKIRKGAKVYHKRYGKGVITVPGTTFMTIDFEDFDKPKELVVEIVLGNGVLDFV